jgi:Tfp pilus assembly protein PilF
MDLAIQKDDQYAPAWALKSILLLYVPNYLSSFNGEPIDLQKIKLDAGTAARKAVTLDPDLAIAHYALANFYREYLSWAMAEDEYLIALNIDPDNIDIIEDYSQFLQSVGRLKESIEISKKGFELEPYTPMAIVNYADKLFFSADNPDAELIEELSHKALKIQPDFAWAINILGALYIQQKDYQGAFDLINNCEECRDLNYNVATMYYLKHLLNSTTPDLSKQSLASTISIDLYYQIVGEEGLLDIFEQIHSFDSITYAQAPFMHKVRKTERYKTLVKFLGLADYWRLRQWPDYCHPISDKDFECD